MNRHLKRILAVGLVLGSSLSSLAVTRTASVSGYWTNTATWGANPVPASGDDVIINGGGIVVTQDVGSANLLSCTINGTLIFSGLNATITSTTVTVNGTVTHLPQSDTNGTAGVYGDWALDNRVWIVCTNLTVAGSGSINVDGKGYAGGGTLAFGPGGAQYASAGGYGGHGGNYGGATAGGAPYGSTSNPQDPGSGGSRGDGANGGTGGGLIRIEAVSAVIVDGSISANGIDGSVTGGGGSGGGIYIGCNTLTGGGAIQVNGGGTSRGGSGGRIAVIYNPASQPVAGVPFITAAGGPGVGDNAAGAYGEGRGWPGSLYFPDNRLLPDTITFSGEWSVPSLASWSPTNLIVSNGWVRFIQSGLQVTTSNLLVTGTDAWMHKLEFTNATVVCSGSVTLARGMLSMFGGSALMPSLTVLDSMTLTNNARVFFYSGATNGTAPAYGALVNVANNLTLWSNCWIYSYSHPTNGGSVFYQAKNVTIATPNAGFNANSGGFGVDYGPGKPQPSGFACGAGYGGEGGRYSSYDYGLTYGNSNAPALPGSGSLTDGGGPGGGLVWVSAAQTIRVNGSVIANGGATYYSGGSGGGIYLICKSFIGPASGLLQAKGGSSNRGGGGGRIAIWSVSTDPSHPIQTDVTNGTGTGESRPGSPGTVVWMTLPTSGTVIMLR